MQTMKTSLLPLLLLSAGIANAQTTPQVPAITSALNDNNTATANATPLANKRPRSRTRLCAAALAAGACLAARRQIAV